MRHKIDWYKLWKAKNHRLMLFKIKQRQLKSDKITKQYRFKRDSTHESIQKKTWTREKLLGEDVSLTVTVDT